VSANAGWISVRVRPGRDRDAVLAALFGAGSQGVQEEADTLLTHFPPGTDADRVREAVLQVDPDSRIETGRTPAIDWAHAWRDQITAHELGALTIVPPWLAGGRPADRTIVIDPGMAFGTGEHATTRGVVRLLQRVVRPGDVVADLGAGSAVLSIAAAKLGARRVAAIEVDPDAIGNAEENVARNAVSDRVTVIEGDATTILPLVAPVRVVLANIVSSVIAALLPLIEGALTPDGEAIVSGMLDLERDDMVALLERRGWRVTAEDREDVWWSAALARR
jgi:ribosomal protein L11 methyltransferase